MDVERISWNVACVYYILSSISFPFHLRNNEPALLHTSRTTYRMFIAFDYAQARITAKNFFPERRDTSILNLGVEGFGYLILRTYIKADTLKV